MSDKYPIAPVLTSEECDWPYTVCFVMVWANSRGEMWYGRPTIEPISEDMGYLTLRKAGHKLLYRIRIERKLWERGTIKDGILRV